MVQPSTAEPTLAGPSFSVTECGDPVLLLSAERSPPAGAGHHDPQGVGVRFARLAQLGGTIRQSGPRQEAIQASPG
jgi:hypothetical protein